MNRLIPIALAVALCGTVASHAGDNNTIMLIQQSPFGSSQGNTLMVDQSQASNSTVTGVGSRNRLLRGAMSALGLEGEYALQRGENNQATLTLTGDGGKLQLLQTSNPLRPLGLGISAGDNTATVVARDFANGTVAQVGSGNTAEMSLGDSATGFVTQLGSRLSTSLEVGDGGTAVITQIGNNSRTPTLLVEPGAAVNYTQIGNNIAPASSTEVQVISASNPGAISITQTAW
ncbi:hypothetical protein ACFSX5_13670 [Devosia albogilva]|uniref:Curlin associated repeat-containing protein n=1 Tax=Devosia albogilva TaxID=429726 RepID=A0ABW5QME2_9HYPH